jgi:hypothetical protein
MTYSAEQLPQFPEIRFKVRGKNDIYDPRAGTTGTAPNWALCVADALTNSEFGASDAMVNQQTLIVAANVCDESTWPLMAPLLQAIC